MTDPVSELIALIARLPGIGKRNATRLALHLVRAREDYVRALGNAIATLPDVVRRCDPCGNVTATSPCPICSAPRRNPHVVCAVEGIADIWAIEAGGVYDGTYHVLDGLFSPLDGIGPEDLRLDVLARRVREQDIREIIVATRSSVEGEATALLIKQVLADTGVRVTRPAAGLPHGAEIEYTDPKTLEQALSGRREL